MTFTRRCISPYFLLYSIFVFAKGLNLRLYLVQYHMEPSSFQDSKRQNRDMLMRRTIHTYKLGVRENKKGRLSTYFLLGILDM